MLVERIILPFGWPRGEKPSAGLQPQAGCGAESVAPPPQVPCRQTHPYYSVFLPSRQTPARFAPSVPSSCIRSSFMRSPLTRFVTGKIPPRDRNNRRRAIIFGQTLRLNRRAHHQNLKPRIFRTRFFAHAMRTSIFSFHSCTSSSTRICFFLTPMPVNSRTI